MCPKVRAQLTSNVRVQKKVVIHRSICNLSKSRNLSIRAFLKIELSVLEEPRGIKWRKITCPLPYRRAIEGFDKLSGHIFSAGGQIVFFRFVHGVQKKRKKTRNFPEIRIFLLFAFPNGVFGGVPEGPKNVEISTFFGCFPLVVEKKSGEKLDTNFPELQNHVRKKNRNFPIFVKILTKFCPATHFS